MIRLALLIGIGGFFGSALRFLISQLFMKITQGIAPSGTLVVNILGSLLLGVLIHFSGKLDRDYYLLLTTGFCGGFTTFSTFSIENINLILTNNMNTALIYISLSVVLGIGAALLGWYIGKTFLI